MKNSLLLIAAVFAVVRLHSQVLINPQVPPAGMVMKSQLWNLALINTSNQEISIQIEMVITDASNNQKVLSGTSRMFQLSKGAKQVKAGDVLPVTYLVGAAGYNQSAGADGFLPIGIFNICYSVITVVEGGRERIGEECETVEVEPVSPPQLVSPADSEQVELSRPLFTWLPPSAAGLFNNLSYDWLLVEVQPTQTAAVAIQQNLPLLRQQNIGVTSFQYPSSSPELDTSKLYAWRISAKSNNRPVANSEVWTFRLKKPDTRKVAAPVNYYVKASREEDASLAVCDGVLGYEYVHELGDGKVDLQLFDLSSPKRRQIALDSADVAVRFGQNFLQLDLRGYKKVVNRHVYMLELTNSRKEKRYVRFQYTNSDNN